MQTLLWTLHSQAALEIAFLCSWLSPLVFSFYSRLFPLDAMPTVIMWLMPWLQSMLIRASYHMPSLDALDTALLLSLCPQDPLPSPGLLPALTAYLSLLIGYSVCLFFCLSGGSFSSWAHLPAYGAWIPIGILFSLSCLSKYHVFQDVQVSVKCILTFIHLFASHQEALLIWRKTSLALVRNRDYCIELTPESFTNSLTQCLKCRNVNLSFWTSLFSFLERDHTYLSCLNKEYVMIN